MLLQRPYLCEHPCKLGQEWNSAASTTQHSTTQHSTAQHSPRQYTYMCLCQDVDMTIRDAVTTANGVLHKQCLQLKRHEASKVSKVSQARCRDFWSSALLKQ